MLAVKDRAECWRVDLALLSSHRAAEAYPSDGRRLRMPGFAPSCSHAVSLLQCLALSVAVPHPLRV
jgi:hypothetical protein